MANPAFVPNKWFTITPSDTSPIGPAICSVILADGAGSVKVSFEDGSIDTFAVAAGQQIPGRFSRIWATPAPPVLHGGLY